MLKEAMGRYYARMAAKILRDTQDWLDWHICNVIDQGTLSDLELRLAYGIPASRFYSIRKKHMQFQQDMRDGKVTLKWRRWGRTG
jgi:hypothetical protein